MGKKDKVRLYKQRAKNYKRYLREETRETVAWREVAKHLSDQLLWVQFGEELDILYQQEKEQQEE